jgi:hypothetical protein
LVFGGSAAMTGKPTGDQNIDTMTVGVDMITLGRDCGISPSGTHIRSKSTAYKTRTTTHRELRSDATFGAEPAQDLARGPRTWSPGFSFPQHRGCREPTIDASQRMAPFANDPIP